MLELLDYIPIRYRFLVPVLVFLGYLIKHKTAIPNVFIPTILFIVASVTGMVIRAFLSTYTGWYFWVDVIFLYGIINGLQTTLISCGGYEAVRALVFSCRREEVKMAKKRPFILFLIAFASATIIFSLISLVLGAGIFGTFSKVTDGWIFGILILQCYDFTRKVAFEKFKVTKTYISMQILILLNVICFSFASTTSDATFSLLGLAGALLFGIAAGILPVIVNRIKGNGAVADYEDTQANDESSYQKDWARIRSRIIDKEPSKQIEILKDCLGFKLVGDDIYGALDLSQPLITGTLNSDGTTLGFTVNSAEKAGSEVTIADGVIESAVSYIESVVNKEAK